MSEIENQPTLENNVEEQTVEENIESTDREINNVSAEDVENENNTINNAKIEENPETVEEEITDSIPVPEPTGAEEEEIADTIPAPEPTGTEEEEITDTIPEPELQSKEEEEEIKESKTLASVNEEQPEEETVETFEAEVVQLSESNNVTENESEEENNDNDKNNDETESKIDTVQGSENIEEKPKEKLDDSIPLAQEANKDKLIRTFSESSEIAEIEDDDVDFNTLSKEELIEKVLFFKDQCKIIKQETDKKIQSSNDYIIRLEIATEQRLDRLRKQNKDDIDEIKKVSDQIIKNEKEKAENYVNKLKKSVEEERDVLRSIENDSRSRYQKEKEEKNEALVEINRLKSMINNLRNDVEDRENKIQNLEEKNLSVFVQKDKEIEQAIIQIENERKNSREIREENIRMKEKINELNDELKQFKNESEIRNSQINLLNHDNQEMSKKIASLTRKNEELSTLYEFKLDESASLKAQIEHLNSKIEHYRRKRHNRLNGISPLTPNTMNAANTSFDPNISRCFSEMSFISTADSVINKSTSSARILDALDERKASSANTANSADHLSDISLGYNDQNENGNGNENEKNNEEGIVTINNITPGATEVETVEAEVQQNSEVNININEMEKPEQRTLVIDTNMTISNNGGDPAFNYQDSNNNMVVLNGEGEEDDDEDEDDDDNGEETIMGSIVKPLVFHTNDQTYINFNEILSEDYSKIYNTKLVKQCELEEIVQCLDLNGTYMGFFSKRKLLNGLKSNIVVIEKANTSNFQDLILKDVEPECALCSLKYTNNEDSILWYKFFFEDEKNPEHEFICMFCRERLVTICNWYKYLSMIAKKIVKHDIETIYINCLQLKENMYHARNGLTTDEDSGILNVVSTNPRTEIIAQRPGDFTDVDIENGANNELLLNKKISFDNTSNSADSITIKNNSEIIDGPLSSTSTGSKKRPSLCYNNTIQKKLSLTEIN
ncbi:hypothetical protein H8356DRAFT_1282887 [Neocallimastix lanati (nom. inval.)]|nr:hypothetical protein H8356DRAFT_1282887 [Neocallimastix sp. JGI-2020a]